MKTIRIPKATLEKWLAALRSGEYQQAEGRLSERGGFCCLGVLQMVVDGDVERFPEDHRGVDEAGDSLRYPSSWWLQAKGIDFFSHSVSGCNPYLPLLGMDAATANDSGVGFEGIAKAIEACADGY